MKYFFIKLCIFLFIIYLCQLLISNVFPAKIPSPAINFNLAKQQGKIDIVYFADSVNDTSDKLDKDLGGISTFLERLLVRKRIGVLGQPASQPDVYAAYAAYVSRLNPLPDHLIIEINMRTFGEIWDYELSYQFEEQKRYFRIFADTPLMPFWSFFSDSASFFNPNSLPENKYQRMSIFNELQKFGFMKDKKHIYNDIFSGGVKDIIKSNYMYDLKQDHRKIKSLVEIADIFARKKTKLIFYFTPINYKPAVDYIGNDFETSLKKNINLVKSLLLKKHVTVLDLSMSFPTKASFTWRENLYNSEHLVEQGRRFVAQSLAIEIQKEN